MVTSVTMGGTQKTAKFTIIGTYWPDHWGALSDGTIGFSIHFQRKNAFSESFRKNQSLKS
jgi:hypothetical protein